MFTPTLAIAAILLTASTPPDDVFRASAHIEGKIEQGETARLIVDVAVKPGWSIEKAGVSNAIIQVDVPSCVKLLGERAKTKKQLARAGFIRSPEERLADGPTTEFEFEPTAPCHDDEPFEINILAYVSPPDGSDAWFVRRRIALPIKRGATSHEVDASKSDWGIGKELQIGDKAPLMKLPRADGTMIDLARDLGKRNIVITTYRAYW